MNLKFALFFLLSPVFASVNLVNSKVNVNFQDLVNGTARIMSQITHICLEKYNTQTEKSSLQEWYHYDFCHKYRCQIRNDKYNIEVYGCQTAHQPHDALECYNDNLNNQKDLFPLCCPRLKCIIVVDGKKYIRTIGQPEEHFADERWPWKDATVSNKRSSYSTTKQGITSDFEYDQDEAFIGLGNPSHTHDEIPSPSGHQDHEIQRSRHPRHPGRIITQVNNQVYRWLFNPVKSFLKSQTNKLKNQIEHTHRQMKEKQKKDIEDELNYIYVEE